MPASDWFLSTQLAFSTLHDLTTLDCVTAAELQHSNSSTGKNHHLLALFRKAA